MKVFIKKLIRKVLNWYIEPLYTENRLLKEQLRHLTDDYGQMSVARKEDQRRLCDIESREEWTRSQFDFQSQRITDIEKREEWTRSQFDSQGKRITDIENRETWVREQFDAQRQRIVDIEGREEWTRERFQEIASFYEELKAVVNGIRPLHSPGKTQLQPTSYSFFKGR